MSQPPELMTALSKMPVIAIVRGIRPDEAADVGDALCAVGVRIIEVPLNSPDPLASIRILAERLGERCMIGAGTVLSAADVDDVVEAGGRLIISPNTDGQVIRRALQRGCITIPGVATGTEVFRAYSHGARCLKLFPATTYGTRHATALRAVLPDDASLLAVGGIGPMNVTDWIRAGAVGVGIGSEIYKPGDDIDAVRSKATSVTEVLAALNNKDEGEMS